MFLCIEPALIVMEEVRLQEGGGDCTSLALVVMPDHIYWLVQLGAGRSLQQIMNSLKGRSAYRINLERSGRQQVWQAGFHDHAIRREEDLESAARYLIQNPVRTGLVERLDQYPFWESVYHDKSHRA
ncbi:MAG: IS200/IS605 family transposase [Woeseiaceae bacterium]|nr:IS200/IS605 family transposase [Woeseiaceae bacterium]